MSSKEGGDDSSGAGGSKGGSEKKESAGDERASQHSWGSGSTMYKPSSEHMHEVVSEVQAEAVKVSNDKYCYAPTPTSRVCNRN